MLKLVRFGVVVWVGLGVCGAQTAPVPAFRQVGLPVDQRVDDLVGRMTVDEKIGQLMMDASGVPRLGIPGYHWWNEGLHGIARDGVATVFPQAIGLAATWDTGLQQQVGHVVAEEARAKNNAVMAKTGGASAIYQGLTIWSPNINIFRDPRWGRGQETYGEDPFLTGRFGVAFVKGLQGDDPKYLETVATLKHFAVHSGPEELRHKFDAVVSDRDLHETYLPAFEAGVTEGGARSLMSAYNAVDGVPAPANAYLLTKTLRETWGFKGAVVGDVDTVADIWGANAHHYVKDAAEASADALKAGTDLCSGTTYKALPEALKRGLVTEADIDVAVKRLLRLRFELGQFDPAEDVRYRAIPESVIADDEHAALALRAERESLVLLKNDGALPWKASEMKTLAVVGPTADDMSALIGNYSGTPKQPVTILQGLRQKLEPMGVKVLYSPAVPLVAGYVEKGKTVPAPEVFPEEMLRSADHILLTLGVTPELEGEEMKLVVEGFSHGDRTTIQLPKVQQELIAKVAALGKPFTVVLTGSASLVFDVSKPDAVLMAWYYGQTGGQAIAETLLGEVNPSGHLPVTFYASDADLPGFTDYSMKNRTYRYFTGTALYPFGYGLSYTTFAYSGVGVSAKKVRAEDAVEVGVTVKNVGKVAGDAVVQVYAHEVKPSVAMPLESLVGFVRVSLKAGEGKKVSVPVEVKRLRRWDEVGQKYVVETGAWELRVGDSSAGVKGKAVVVVR